MAADYEYYRDTYLGSLLTEENFPKYALRADSYLDLLTTGRYEKDCLPEKAAEAVKMAECAIAELCLNLEQAELQSDAAWKCSLKRWETTACSFATTQRSPSRRRSKSVKLPSAISSAGDCCTADAAADKERLREMATCMRHIR